MFDLNLFVDFAPMANVVEIDSTLGEVEFIEHPVIANSKLEFRPPGQPLVREALQSRPHRIHFSLDHFSNRGRQ